MVFWCFDSFLITKAIRDWGELLGIHGKAFGKLINMKNRSFEVLFHKQIRNTRRGSKEKSAMNHSWWQSFQQLLEHFLKSNLYMLYFVSKIRKSTIQFFKRCTNRSWNEEVRAIGSRSLQAEGQFRRAAKSAFGCEMISQPSCLSAKWFRSHLVCLRNFTAILCACEILLSASRYLRPTFFDILLQIFDV